MNWRICHDKLCPVSLLSRYLEHRRAFQFSGARFLRRIKQCSYSNAKKEVKFALVAHVDAGKTTTCEQMLYNCGSIDHVGNVDDGDTVTDFLAEERNRGITVRSAAVRMPWKNCNLTLIDTPGHVDFFCEVKNSLDIIDGAVVILDVRKGVQAQTRQIWSQLNDKERIVFLNKCDLANADVNRCLRELKELDAGRRPLLTNILENGTVYDLVNKKVSTAHGRPEQSADSSIPLVPIQRHRSRLIDEIADLDEATVEYLISKADPDVYSVIRPEFIHEAITRLTADKAYAVIVGSAKGNIGVRQLLDAVSAYFPPFTGRQTGRHCLVYVFKLQYNSRLRKFLAFVRIESAKPLNAGTTLYTRSGQVVASRLYLPYAEDLEQTNILQGGSVGVILFSPEPPNAGQWLSSDQDTVPKEDTEDLASQCVYMCSIEPFSSESSVLLKNAVRILSTEEPSLMLANDEGRNVSTSIELHARGVLQVEVAVSRLQREFNIQCRAGPIEIIKYECVLAGRGSAQAEGVKLSAESELSMSDLKCVWPSNLSFVGVNVRRSSEHPMDTLNEAKLKLINAGVKSALSHGVISSYPIVGLNVFLDDLSFRGSPARLSYTATQIMRTILEDWGRQNAILEPVVKMVIWMVNDTAISIGSVVGELVGKHKGQILHASSERIVARCPLDALGKDFASRLRSLTHGMCSIQVENDGYDAM